MLDENTGMGITLDACSGNEGDCSDVGFAEVMFVIAADCDDGSFQFGSRDYWHQGVPVTCGGSE